MNSHITSCIWLREKCLISIINEIDWLILACIIIQHIFNILILFYIYSRIFVQYKVKKTHTFIQFSFFFVLWVLWQIYWENKYYLKYFRLLFVETVLMYPCYYFCLYLTQLAGVQALVQTAMTRRNQLKSLNDQQFVSFFFFFSLFTSWRTESFNVSLVGLTVVANESKQDFCAAQGAGRVY